MGTSSFPNATLDDVLFSSRGMTGYQRLSIVMEPLDGGPEPQLARANVADLFGLIL